MKRNAINIYEKNFFECLKENLLSVSILSDLLLLVIGVSKRAIIKEYLILGMKCKQSKGSTQNKMGAEGGRSMVFGIWLGLFKAGSQSEHNFFFFHNSIEGSHSK